MRRRYLALRTAIPAESAATYALELKEHVLRAVPPSTHCVAGYAATRGEIDLFPALSALHARGVRICLPVVAGGEKLLAFRAWAPEKPLVSGPFGILEPEEGQKLLTPSIVLAPLLAFDKNCHRLGYGGGYYDRTLLHMRREGDLRAAIGTAFSCQEAPCLPVEEHDAQLDAIITEKGLITNF